MKTPQLDPYHLIVFYYVARGKSLSAAARDLYLTQPAITSHIKTLERSAGLKLIQVIKQRVSLTPAGEGLFQYAKEIYNQSVGAERFIEVTRESGLSIGVTSLFSSIISPLIEKMFYELSPNMRFSVVNKESQFLIHDVLD
jgi:DNA-binding transcriptional LysR family regulator